LPSGPIPPNPLELLSKMNLDEFLIHARASFDVVIIDTPALSVGEDAAIIAARTGSVLAVARSGSTRVNAFNDMVQGLTESGTVVVGSVLNDVPALKKAKKK
jgi:receptor protein-tyrosine kinase